jgi:hypothetical protein
LRTAAKGKHGVDSVYSKEEPSGLVDFPAALRHHAEFLLRKAIE